MAKLRQVGGGEIRLCAFVNNIDNWDRGYVILLKET